MENTVLKDSTIALITFFIFRLKVILRTALAVKINSQEKNMKKIVLEKLTSYACDINGSANGDVRDMSAKYFDEIAKWYTEEIISFCEKSSDEEFSKADSKLLTTLPCYYAVSNTAGNKLKAKKWYNEHSIEGLPISDTYYFWGIDESKDPDFAYELKFSFFDNELKAHFFSVLSNNDSYIDLKEDTKVKIEGTIRSVKFSDFGNDYKVSNLVIVEK